MQINKGIFDQIKPGEIFWTVTTRLLNGEDPIQTNRTFVCVKGRTGTNWEILHSFGTALPDDIARYGDKINDLQIVRTICPCDEEVLALYLL